ncbi:hypothetical protein U1Q18_048420, partial [Sarracenia purpurea var. burkii]
NAGVQAPRHTENAISTLPVRQSRCRGNAGYIAGAQGRVFSIEDASRSQKLAMLDPSTSTPVIG